MRVFARAKLPLSLINQPELLVLLRDQVHLLEYASRDIGERRALGAAGIGGRRARPGCVWRPSVIGAPPRSRHCTGQPADRRTSAVLDESSPRYRWAVGAVDAEIGMVPNFASISLMYLRSSFFALALRVVNSVDFLFSVIRSENFPVAAGLAFAIAAL